MSKIWWSQRDRKWRHNMAHTRCMLDMETYRHTRACTHSLALAPTRTHAHPYTGKYVILIAFPLQKFRERDSILSYTYIGCVVHLEVNACYTQTDSCSPSNLSSVFVSWFFPHLHFVLHARAPKSLSSFVLLSAVCSFIFGHMLFRNIHLHLCTFMRINYRWIYSVLLFPPQKSVSPIQPLLVSKLPGWIMLHSFFNSVWTCVQFQPGTSEMQTRNCNQPTAEIHVARD